MLFNLLNSITFCLFTYFKIEHQCYTFMYLFPFITDINGFLEIPTPPPRLLNVRKISDPPSAPFIFF